MKTFLAFLVTLLLALGVQAQPKAPQPVSAETAARNALEAAIAKGDTNRAALLSNALFRLTNRPAATLPVPTTATTTQPTGPGAPPPRATPPGVPTAQPVNPALQPAAPGIVPPPVAGAPAPAPGAAAPRIAAPAPGSDDEVFPPGVLKFQDAEVGQVLDLYQDFTGRTVLRPATLPAAKITIKTQTQLTRREAVQALDTILSMNGVTMIPQGEKFVKAVAEAQALKEAGQFNDVPSDLLPDAAMFVTEVVQLKNATPNDILPVIQPFAKMPGASIITVPSANVIVLRDYAENVKRMVEMIERVDIMPILEFEPVVIPIKYALAADIAQVLSSLTSGGGATTVGQPTTRTGLTTGGGGVGGFGRGTGGFGGTGGYGGAFGGGAYGGGAYGAGYNPQATGLAGGAAGVGGMTGGAAGRSSFADRLRSIVNRASGGGGFSILGETQIIADERTNSLLIFANKQDLISISNIIEKLDVVLAQVLIEAVVIEVGLSDNTDLSISYLQHAKTRGNVTGAGALRNNNDWNDPGNLTSLSSNLASGFSYFLRWNDTLDVALRAFGSDSKINVLSRPRVQTSHAVEANMFVGETRPYPSGSYGGIGYAYNSINQQPIGITLSVLPLINPDGLVVMDIRARVQNVGEEVTIQGVGNVPSTIEREANAKVAVRDQETIILGGFISSDQTKTKSGVPILKDLPVLGYLFRGSSDRKNRRELLIMIRPTVLPTPASAAEFALRAKSNMPGVMDAERDVSREEQKRLDKERKALLKREGLNQ